MPEYTPYQIPSLQGLLDVYSQSQQARAGMRTGQDIASSFGFEDADQYAEFFNPMDLDYIQEGLGQLPLLQRFLQNNANQGYISNMGQLSSRVGRTGMAGMGTDRFVDELNRKYSNEMLGADERIQNIVDRFRGLLGDEFSGMQSTAQSILAGGAELTDSSPRWQERGFGSEQGYQHQQLQKVMPDLYKYDWWKRG